MLARLEREGLKPSPEADRATLIRRVTLDLTGLPPTPAEVDAFLADSADAYEKRGRPPAGFAALWRAHGAAAGSTPPATPTRTATTSTARDMWPWRDWVIDAFNRNLPFDQFTIEQLAGDLLPNATLEQRIASGFNRNHMINFEGGAIPKNTRWSTSSIAWTRRPPCGWA